MNRHYRGRALAAASLVALMGVSLLPSTAMAGSTVVAASAWLRPGTQYLGDSTGQVFRLRVRNSAAGSPIGAVRITRPSSLWTVIGCPAGPAGWARTAAADSCEYTSNPGDADDIPAGSARNFRMTATTGAASHNVWGTWAVTVSSSDNLATPINNALASPMPMGLRTRAFSFQIVDAVISDTPATVGDPCPATDKSAIAGSTGNFLIVCGRNRTDVAQTTVNQNSKLLGSMIAAHGAFAGGLVASSSDVVVLGYWNDVQVNSNPGAGKAVRLRVGSANTITSPVTRIAGFSAVGGPSGNSAPVANDDPSYSTGEDTQLIVPLPGGLVNDTDADSDTLMVSSVQGNALNVGTATATAQGGSVTLSANGSFVFDPKPNFTGTDTFTYTVTDGTDGSAAATVSVQVGSTQDAPILDAITSPALLDMSEDAGTPSGVVGTPVSALVDAVSPSGGLDNVTDSDGPGLGIAIVGGAATGTLWWSSDNGTNWLSAGVPSVRSDASALLVKSGSGPTTGRIYYQPAANANGTITSVILFRAWDESAGGNGFYNLPSNGGTSSVSSATDEASINVTAVNDAPTATNDSFSMNENTTVNSPIPGVLDVGADVDGDSLQAILVTGPAHHNGTFTLNTNGSFTYQPAANFVGSDSFTWKARDPSNAESAVVTMSITVNDNPGGGGGGGGGCLIVC